MLLDRDSTNIVLCVRCEGAYQAVYCRGSEGVHQMDGELENED